MLFVDVDRFESVNDELGHDAGDQVLTAVAHRLRGAVRPSDTVARLGGDELTVICVGLVDGDAARVVARHVLAALEAPVPLGRHQHRVAVSVGVATVTDGSIAAARSCTRRTRPCTGQEGRGLPLRRRPRLRRLRPPGQSLPVVGLVPQLAQPVLPALGSAQPRPAPRRCTARLR